MVDATGLKEGEKRTKRKYTKHDYFVDLDKNARAWNVLLKQFKLFDSLYKRIDDIGLENLEKICSDYIISFNIKKEEKESLYSESIQDLFTKLQNILHPKKDKSEQNESSKEEKTEEERIKLYATIHTLNNIHQSVASLVENSHELFKEKSRQERRITDIEELIRFEERQILKEKNRLQSMGKDREGDFAWESCTKSIETLRKRVKNDRATVKRIQTLLQKKAQKLCQLGEACFSEKSENDCKVELQIARLELKGMFIKELKRKKRLSDALVNLQNAVKKESEEKSKKTVAKQEKQERTPEEQIIDGFNEALKAQTNIVLIGKFRSLGLTHPVIKDILEDETFRDDIISYISGLLKTQYGKDFGRSGNERWKKVLGSDGLSELSINPKSGHSQAMPRLYAKKELFVQDDTTIELTNNKDKRKTATIPVVVKKAIKGSTKTQENDMDVAEKFFFQNDGKQHDGERDGHALTNNLGWIKKVIYSDDDTPQKLPIPHSPGGRQ